MPSYKQQAAAVDHAEEALANLAVANRSDVPELVPHFIAKAQVHATLALVDEVRAFRESLGGGEIKDALIGEIQHVGREFIEIFWRANGGRN